MNKPKRIIITGGPGAGKSSLLDRLSSMGYGCLPEVSREVIREFHHQHISPWGNLQAFVKLVFERIYAELQLPVYQLTFCDRSFLDGIAYLREAGLTVPKEFLQPDPHIYYAREVFILPPWMDIYRQDPARQQEFDKAVSLYGHIRETYLEFGFKLIELPPLPIEKRVRFIQDSLNKEQYLSLSIHSA